MSKWFALVDCNNFFVSWERVFRPDLWNKPVGVLSNNDGCFVARSQEVKNLGIPMGAPVFKYKELIKEHNVKLFSSNFSLYGEFSSRVMNLLHDMSPDVSIYSIDEAFLIPPKNKPLEEWRQEIPLYIKKCTGIPVSVGIGRTKTLAKVANEIAKKSQLGILLLDSQNEEHYLSTFPAGDVWGVGRKLNEKLRLKGIDTSLELRDTKHLNILKELKLPGKRTQKELNGEICWKFNNNPDHQKSIMSTRSFGNKITTLSGLESALANNIVGLLNRNRCKMSYTKNKGSIAYEMSKVQSG